MVLLQLYIYLIDGLQRCDVETGHGRFGDAAVFDAVRRDEPDVTDVRVEIARVEIDGHHRVAAQRRVHVKRAVDPTAGRFAAKFLFVNLSAITQRESYTNALRIVSFSFIRSKTIFFFWSIDGRVYFERADCVRYQLSNK